MSTPFTTPYAATAQQAAVLIRQAVDHWGRGELPAAEITIARVLAIRPTDPDAVHLLGLIRAAQARHGEAETLYRRSLTFRPGQAEVMVNLGNTLRELARDDEAIASYREAIATNRDFANAHVSLASALDARNDLEGAERAYRNALRIEPTSISALQGLGSVLNDLGRAEEGETANKKALALLPKHPTQHAALQHNLGVSLKLQGRFEEALEQYAKAQAIAPDMPLVETNRASALEYLGRFDDALASYRRALEKNPLDMIAHQHLNRLLYRMGRDDEFLRSFDEASKTSPSPALPLGKAHFLTSLERFAEAREAAERATKLAPDSPVPHEAMGTVLAGQGEFDAAIRAFERALALDPKSDTARGNLATALLRAGDAVKARDFAQEALAQSPTDQANIAILGLAARALGDAQDETFNDYESLVQVFDLEPPKGYLDMESFNRDLNDYLDRFHTDRREHFDQTLRHGTQTLDRLFSSGHDLVERLRARIDEAVETYIQRMKDAPEHPLHGRRRERFAYSGSWSSRLNDCGFHTNHIHTRGWISSCYYIALPDAVADTEGKQGWIKFGEPNFEMGLKDPVRRAVQPAPGRLVLFPSYMWHGTVPFRSSQSRTTIAFDAVPK